MAFVVASTAYAMPGKPTFEGVIWGDGTLWGTKGTALLPAHNEHNLQSYDMLFKFTNGDPMQLPVAEAAPGNPAFNGGRWFTQAVTWTPAGLAAYAPDPPPILKSYDEIMTYLDMTYLTITAGDPNNGPTYFDCPLLPVMSE